ncbi:MAG: GDP-mannose 4,6-dehydratase [Acidobacteria bacterium]|nr:GDP-mannose 4,6-dehydratase [Acidobacteriota bacterium]
MAASPLVTGAAGFAGSHLVDHLLEIGNHVWAWGKPFGRSTPPREDGRVTWRSVDVLDGGAVAKALAESRPSAIYHCAGVADVTASWSHPPRALEVNALGTHRVLEAVRHAGLDCPVLITGSALVYAQSSAAIDEDAPLQPSTPYGASKLAQEMIAARADWCPVLIARPFNHAGPRQSPSYVTSSFARQIAQIEAGLSDAVLRVGNLESRRDITDVRDTVRAYTALVERGRPSRPYNVCRGEAYRIADLLETLVGMARKMIRIEVDPARLRPSDIPVVLGSPRRIQAETGWQSEIPIQRTLADLLDYWRRVTAHAAAART